MGDFSLVGSDHRQVAQGSQAAFDPGRDPAGLYTYDTAGAAYGLWHFRTFFETSWNVHLGTALRGLEASARRNNDWPRSQLRREHDV